MTKAGWTLDDIAWQRFDRSKVDQDLLMAVKAACVVEFNAPDYVDYLKAVFPNDADLHATFDQWGGEEAQHGRALAAWVKLADPEFDFEATFEAFREGYRPPHFDDAAVSVRGSRRGEMIARCVVESGTTSYYSAMRDATEEPVLKQIAAHIAGDEMRHWRLFFDLQQVQPEPELGLLKKIRIAAGRLGEAEDDELGYAYYCANTPIDRIGIDPYDRKACVKAYETRVLRLWRPQHLDRAVGMIAAAVGLRPKGWLARGTSRVLWSAVKFKNRGHARNETRRGPGLSRAA
ncbi:MAG: ferritin-like domain-containing protein [Alphaproteobacteria bacterium]|nr:ferritin-like domain-containing protein [Alphaproteobacteria bacterium]